MNPESQTYPCKRCGRHEGLSALQPMEQHDEMSVLFVGFPLQKRLLTSGFLKGRGFPVKDEFTAEKMLKRLNARYAHFCTIILNLALKNASETIQKIRKLEEDWAIPNTKRIFIIGVAPEKTAAGEAQPCTGLDKIITYADDNTLPILITRTLIKQHLTPEQRSALGLYNKGYAAQDAAPALGVSEDAYLQYIKTIKEAFQIRSDGGMLSLEAVLGEGIFAYKLDN